MSIQWVAALVIAFREKTTAILTAVALDVEIAIQSHDADGLLLAWGRHDRLLAHRAAGSKFLVKVLDAMNEPTGVHSEGDPIQAAVAHHTGEAVRVIGLPRGTKDSLHDGLGAYIASLQGVDVAGLAVSLLFHSVEGLPAELAVAGDAGKAIHVEDLIHGGASRTFPNYIFTAASTATKVFFRRWIVHVIQHLFGQVLKLIFWTK